MTVIDVAAGGGRSLIGVGNPALGEGLVRIRTGSPAGSGIEEAAIAKRSHKDQLISLLDLAQKMATDAKT